MTTNIKIFLKLLLIVFLAVCLFKMPYGYYQFVRYMGMVLFILFAYDERKKEDKTVMIVWLLCAVLLNPFIKIALGRTIWNVIDIILSLILSYSIKQDLAIRKK